MADAGLAAIYAQQRPMLLRLLAARLGSMAEAEDAVQELWLRVAAQSDRPLDSPVAYLFRMANNLATDRRLAARRRGALDAVWLEAQPGGIEQPGPERIVLARAALAEAEAIIAAMPERMRAAYRLFRLEQVPQREIAARLGISLSAVEKLLQRAYRRLHGLETGDGRDD